MEEMEELYNKRFEDIKHTDENGVEFWYARELMKVLKYSKWENFKKVIIKAMDACKNSGISIKDCFPDVRKPIISGKGKEEFIEDYKLTRYACYLIAQNGDSRKKVIALAQTYFAVQTRKQELSEKVRKAIADIGGTMPEDLPTPEKSLKELEKENQKKLKV